MASSSAAIRLPEYAWVEDDDLDGDDRELTPTPSMPGVARGTSRPRLTLAPPAPASGANRLPVPPRPSIGGRPAAAAPEPTLRRQLQDQTVRIVELLEAGLSPVAVSMILRHELGLPTYYTLPHIRAMAPEHLARPRGRQRNDDGSDSEPTR